MRWPFTGEDGTQAGRPTKTTVPGGTARHSTEAWTPGIALPPSKVANRNQA
jgi:hypothetical protein